MPPGEEAIAWMDKAATDLEAARRLLESEALTGPAAFHCQQAVEKALKGLLVSLALPFDKVHAIAYLFDLLSEEGIDLGMVRDDAEQLTLFAVTQRYPGPHEPPSEEAAHHFLVTAERLFEMVQDQLGGSS